MSDRYDAGRSTIGSLLSVTSPRVVVPDWQRSYSWTADHVQAFWLDLLAFDEQYPGDNLSGQEYFLGSTVLVTGGAEHLLLDGQQRLATATILLSTLRDARRSFMADAATRLQNNYIAAFDDETGTTTPILTLNHYDRAYFRAEVQDERLTGQPRPTPGLKSHQLIKKARDFFADRIAEQSEQAGGGEGAFKRNLRIGNVLTKGMSVVVVTSDDEDNASTVFETLNDRGIGLSTADLTRNLLLRRANGDDARQRIVEAWLQILGIADDASVDDFLRHYWVSLRGDIKTRKLYKEIRDAITVDDVDSVEFSLAMAEAALTYRDIASARETHKDVQRSLQAMRELGAKVLYPAMLAGYSVAEENDEKDSLANLAQALVSLYVRYSVVANRESTVLETKVFKTAIQLRADKDFAAAIESLAQLAPPADEFVRRFRAVSVPRIATARYVLREVEHAKRRTQEVKIEDTDRVHVEHIYPQKPESGKWLNHAAIINRLGNLSLLGRRLNTSIQNAEFPEKKEKGYKTSDILLTKELMEVDVWDAAAVDRRQVELSNWVFNIWKFPGESAPVLEEETVTHALDEELPEIADTPSAAELVDPVPEAAEPS